MLLSIQALLSAPNPDDPLANDVAEQWKKNESQAIETGEEKIYFFFLLDHSGWAVFLLPQVVTGFSVRSAVTDGNKQQLRS